VRRTNTARTGPETDQSKKEAYKKYKEQLKAANLWIEPDTYNAWTPALKKAHSDKVKAKRVGKKARATQAAAAATTPATIPEMPALHPPLPPSYATAAAGTHAAIHSIRTHDQQADYLKKPVNEEILTKLWQLVQGW
jgi:hypothetical protein